MLKKLFAISLIGCLLTISGCVLTEPPLEEFSLARAALDAARAVDAARHSTGYYHQAEEAYRRGRAYFEDRKYGSAKDEFLNSRQAAERAENSARLIRFKSGEVL